MDLRMSRVFVAGSINMDLVAQTERLPRAGETVLGNEFASLPGGKGANQAIAAARLGAVTSLIGRVGEDELGKRLSAFLAANNVDVSHVVPTDVSTGVAFVLVGGAGENAIVVIPGANGRLTTEDLDAVPVAAGDVVVCQFETPLGPTESFLARCKALGARTILNPAPAQVCPRRLLELPDLLVLNETELAFLLQEPSLDISSTERAIAAASRLRMHPDQVVITTLGARGCVAVSRAGALPVPGLRVNAIDTTGAGDCFIGATAARLAAGDGLEAALTYANAAAALTVQRRGAGPAMPTAAEVDTLTR
jgi:ribokinase